MIVRNRNRFNKINIGRAAVNGTLENLVMDLLNQFGPAGATMQQVVDIMQGEQSKNRFIGLAAKAWANNKSDYFGYLMQLATINMWWISEKDTERGKALIERWKSLLNPDYDPADLECNRFPFPLSFPGDSAEAPTEYQFAMLLIEMKWAVMEAQFRLRDGTLVAIMHVADIPLGVD